MLENLNYSLFYLLNAKTDVTSYTIYFVQFIAKDLINIVPLLIIILWLWGTDGRVIAQRQLVVKILLALSVSLVISWILGYFFPYNHPFVGYINNSSSHYIANDSFPSDHGTVIFTFALAFLFWHRVWSGITLMAVAFFISWSRIYLGIHWPLDMLGGFLVGIISCLIAYILWNIFGQKLYYRLQHIYHICFAIPIRKGWVSD